MTQQNIDLASLTSSQGIKIFGANSGDYSGYSVSGTGDINGDGFNDVVIGAPYASTYGRINAGIVYVIFANNVPTDIDLSTLTKTQGITIQGIQSGSLCGWSVSAIEDVNEDGYDDILIGCPYANHPTRGISQTGASYIIYGGSANNIDLLNLSSSQGIAIYGPSTNARNGWSVSSAGDINGDGREDIVIGAPYASDNDKGVTTVLFSPFLFNIDLVKNLQPSEGFTITGASNGDNTGRSVSNLGDVNGDGIDDIATCGEGVSYNGNSHAGACYIIYGTRGFISNIVLSNLNSKGFAIRGTGSFNGVSNVKGIGDFNKDGINDFVVDSSTGYSALILGISGSRSDIYFSSSFLTQGFYIYLSSSDGHHTFGMIGDINEDGFCDFIAGPNEPVTPNAYNVPTSTFATNIYICYGNADTANIAASSFASSQGINLVGSYRSSVSGESDINRDASKEVIIGQYLSDVNGKANAGITYIIFANKLNSLPSSAPSQTALTLSSTSVPTESPTFKYLTVYVENNIPVEGNYENEEFIINSPTFATVKGGSGIDRFIIKINKSSTYTITDFTASDEAIDLSAFKDLHNMRDLHITSGPTTLHLPDNQSIQLLNLALEELTEKNFIFTQYIKQEYGSDSKNHIPSWVLPTVVGVIGTAALGGIGFLLKIMCCQKRGGHNSVHATLPIGISLINKEIELIKYEQSNVKFDYYNNNCPVKTSWVGPNDAILVYDHNDNKKVDFAKEIVLTEWCCEAKTDFEAMLCNFDSNQDKVFNKEDQEFAKFYLWQDKNQDGVSQTGELLDLEEAGLVSIDFNTQAEIHDEPRELGALNKAKVLWEDGRITYAYDLFFTHDA